MNMKFVLMAITSATLLSGCALIRGNNNENINIIEQASTARFEAYGAEKINVIGMTSMKSETRCSAVEFFNHIVETFPEAEDMINVRMEESSLTSGNKTTYSCKYTGLAISYTPLTLAESKAWEKAKRNQPAKKEKTDIVVISGKAEAPSCAPCTCVTCGCQPCAAFSSPNN